MNNEKSPVSLEDIYNLIREVKGDLTSKIDDINKEVKAYNKKIDQELRNVKLRLDMLEGENSQLKKKLEITEKKLRKNNLIFYGVKGSSKETQSNLVHKITQVINEYMEINFVTSELSNCYRIGRGHSPNKPILATFISQIKRGEVLGNGKKLKGTDIYVGEDLIEKDLQERKILVEHLKTARKSNHKAIIKGNKLYIDNKEYSVQDLEHLSYTSTTSGYYSPPPVRLTNSEPSTPIPQSSEEEQEAGQETIVNKENTQLQNLQDKGDRIKKKNTRKPSTDQTPKRNQPTRLVTQQKTSKF